MRRFTCSIIACLSLLAGPAWAQSHDALRLLDGYGNRMTSTDGKLNVHPDVEGGGGIAITQYNQGTTAADQDTMMMAGCVRADTPTIAPGVLDGERARCIVDATGKLWVNVGSVTVTGTLTGITNPVSVTGSFFQSTQPVSLATAPTTPVTGTFWQATQPISGSVSVSNLPTTAATTAVSIRCVNTAGNAFEGCGGSATAGLTDTELRASPVPMSGTVTANAGTNLNTSALALDASVDGIEGALGAIADAAATVGSTGSLSAKLRLMTSQLDALQTELNQKTEPANTQIVGDGSGPLTVDGTVTANAGSGTFATLDRISTAIFNGQQAVTASAVALPSNASTEICVKALISNPINVFVGTTAVTISTGLELAPGDAYCVRTDNSADVLVIASTTGASVSFAGRN